MLPLPQEHYKNQVSRCVGRLLANYSMCVYKGQTGILMLSYRQHSLATWHQLSGIRPSSGSHRPLLPLLHTPAASVGVPSAASLLARGHTFGGSPSSGPIAH